MRTIRLTCIAVLVFAVVAGCSKGPPTGDVHGKVTFKGQPVKEGLVTFLNPNEGGAAEAEIGTDGTYSVKKVVVGEYLVVITPPVVIVDTDPGKSPPAPVEKRAPNIPQKYRQQGRTPFKATIKQGTNEHNFDMAPR